MYGLVARQMGEETKALEDYRRELQLHPEETVVYAMMADAEAQAGKKEEAEADLERWVHADSSNPMAAARLAAMLLNQGQVVKAEAVAEAAMARLTGEARQNEPLRLELGQAELRAGSKDKGSAVLAGLLRSTQSPGVMNDCAYELADAGLELPLAESSARSALAHMVAESRTWTLDEDPALLLSKTHMIVATWDTLGWVLFREGKLQQAESYAQAAWQGQQSMTVGEHRGEIEETLEHKDEALLAYTLALGTGPENPAAGSPMAADEQKLQARIAAVYKAGAKGAPKDTFLALQKIRTYPLGSAAGLSGVQEYKLLLTGGKVERAEPSGAIHMAAGAERLMKLDLSRLWPSGSDAKLVRKGMLNCHASVCELVLEP